MMHLNWKHAVSLTVLSMSVFVSDSNSASFRLRETNASGVGYAMAGAAAAPEGKAAEQFDNTAVLGFMEKSTIELSTVLLKTNAKFKVDSASEPFSAVGNLATARNTGNGGNAGGTFLIPAFYLAHKVSKSWTLGFSFTTPFGLKTEYNPEWSGRSHAITSDLKTYDLAPALAWRVNEWLSLGAGMNVQYADAELSRHLRAGAAVNAVSTIRGHSWGYGGNFGVLVAPTKTTKLGLAWRTAVKQKVKGDVKYTNGTANPAAMTAAQIATEGTRAEATIKLPDILTLSGSWDVSKMWKLLATVEWTKWSTIPELRVKFPKGNFKDSVETFKYKDTWFYSIGTICQLNPFWAVKFGFAYDQTPTVDGYRSPRIPDANRMWFSTGADYKFNDQARVSLNYAYINIKDPKVNMAGSTDPNSPEVSKGNLVGKVKADSHLIGLSLNFRF